MTVTLAASPRYQWQGLSTDTKPTDSRVGVNDLFFAYDTGNLYIYNGTSWNLYAIGGGGGGGSGNYLGAYSSLAALDTAKPPASQTAGQVAYAPDSGLVVADGTLYNAIVTGVPQSGGIEGAPAIIRGTVYPARWPGVTQGSSIGSTLQAANLTALQAAIAYAGTNSLWFVFEPGTYEIIGGGLAIPYNDFWWLGSRRTYIVQYSNNQPCVHLGNPLGSSSSTDGITMQGANLKYSGTGIAGANALELTGVLNSDVADIDIGDVFASSTSVVSIPYNGVYFDPNVTFNTCFSNEFRNIKVKFWVNYAWFCDNNNSQSTTGNVFSNLYCSCGDSTGQLSCSGGVWFRYQGQLSITQLNLEWFSAQRAAHFEQVTCGTVGPSNIEGITLLAGSSGTSCGFVEVIGNQMAIRGVKFYDNTILTANNVGQAQLFMLGSSTYLDLDDIHVEDTIQTGTNSPPLYVIANFSGGGNTNPEVALGQFFFQSNAGCEGFSNFVSSSGTWPIFTSVRQLNNYAIQALTDAAVTVYGVATCGVFTMTPTVARNLTLSNAWNSVSGAPVLPAGVFRKVICNSGAAGTIVVINGGTGGGTIATMSAGSTASFAFDGTNWNYIGP
jgi:hypothetical protein